MLTRKVHWQDIDMVASELATGGWPGEGIPDIDEERVLQAPEDADFAQDTLGLLWAAQHIRDPLEGHLQCFATLRSHC